MCGSGCSQNAPDAFSAYANALRGRLLPARVSPMVDFHPPDDNQDGAWQGTVGIFESLPAIVQPYGPWYPDYTGIVPVSAQQQIVAPEPWTVDEG